MPRPDTSGRSSAGLTRRSLARAALAAAWAAWTARPVQAQPLRTTWRATPFSLGIASGQPRADSLVLWTRLYEASLEPALQQPAQQYVPVRYEVYGDASLRQLLRSGTAMAWAHRAFSVHVHLGGLPAGREFFYRFIAGDAVSPVGRARTAPGPAERVGRLRLALASCQHYEHGLFSAHRDLARQDLDLVVFVGDYIYESTRPASAVRAHGAPAPLSLTEYRERHALYKKDADLQAAHAMHTWVMTWDDHEVVNDYARDMDQAYTEPRLFLRRRAAAYRAYFEHMPLLHEPQGSDMRIHDRFSWGTLADLWTLDCRQYRSPHACPDPLRGGGRVLVSCDELVAPDRSMLGSAQEQWLAQGLGASTRKWRLIAQASQISSSGLDTPLGRSVYSDGWDGYPAARQRLLAPAAAGAVDNMICLGGDVHRHVAADLRERPNDDRSPVVASEFVTTSISSRGSGRALMDRVRAANPDVLHARGDERGYAIIELTPTAALAQFRSTPHPAAAGSVFGVQARFRVESGRAGAVAD